MRWTTQSVARVDSARRGSEVILVISVLAVLWGLGAIMGASIRARFILSGVVMALVLAVQVALPAEAALRKATGGDIRLWILLGASILLVLGYRAILRRLREKARPAPAIQTGTFSEAELRRYARHMMLKDIGGPGQKALKEASVLVVGAGGLGSPALLYLAAAGVGHLAVVDDDTVDNSNLQRQIIHEDAMIGADKTRSAMQRLTALNPHVRVTPMTRRLDASLAKTLFADFDVILDGSDNFDTRYLVNAAAVAAKKPLIAGAMSQWEGQISLYDPARGAPCYQCVFPKAPAPGVVPSCAEAGVVGPLPGVIGSIMALETVKVITGAGESLRGRLMLFDGLYAESRVITVKPRSDCPICGSVD